MADLAGLERLARCERLSAGATRRGSSWGTAGEDAVTGFVVVLLLLHGVSGSRYFAVEAMPDRSPGCCRWAEVQVAVCGSNATPHRLRDTAATKQTTTCSVPSARLPGLIALEPLLLPPQRPLRASRG